MNRALEAVYQKRKSHLERRLQAESLFQENWRPFSESRVGRRLLLPKSRKMSKVRLGDYSTAIQKKPDHPMVPVSALAI